MSIYTLLVCRWFALWGSQMLSLENASLRTSAYNI